MKYLVLLVIGLFVSACGQSSNNTVTPLPTPIPQFQAYQMNSQDLPAGVLTQVQSSTLYLGSYSQYDSATSTWTPGVNGLYYIDDQETILGTYTESTVTFVIELYQNGSPYLLNTTTLQVPINTQVSTTLRINSLMYFDVNSNTQAYVSVSSGTNTIVSAWSEFEGYYIGISTPVEPVQP